MALIFRYVAFFLLVTSAARGESAPGEGLTLDDAIRFTLERNPRIAALREAHLAAAGRRLEAGAWPNPVLNLDVQDVRFGDTPGQTTMVRSADGALVERSRGRTSNSGFKESELTLYVSQMIELGGKRARRIALEEQGIQVALWDYEVERANAIAQTRQTFIGVLAAQENLALRRRLAQVAGEATQTVQVRVESGKDSPILRDRAEIEHAQARIELATAERALTAARFVLAAQWDDREAAFESVRGDLYQADAPPDRKSLESAFERSPDLARWTAEVARREAALEVERSKRVPDLTLNLGWRGTVLPESEERNFDAGGALSSVSRTHPDNGWSHSLVFGASVPLPFFRRNRGGMAEAEHLAAQATHERRAEYAGAWARIAAVHSDLDAVYAEIAELRDRVMPAAERAYAAAQVGFEGGKFTYLDVLDSQRTLFRVQGQYLDAFTNYQRGVAEFERLLGVSPISMTATEEGTSE